MVAWFLVGGWEEREWLCCVPVGTVPGLPELPATAEILQPEEGTDPSAFRELWRLCEGSSLIFLFLCCIPSSLSRVWSTVAAQ